MSAGAQDATPADAGECVATTPDENVVLVENLIAAFEAGDAETVDSILADDLVYDIDRYGLPDDPASNDDEISLAAMQEQIYPGSVTTINETIAAGDKVVSHQTLTITEHLLTGESIVLDAALEVDQVIIYTIECGEIVHLHGVVDEYELFTGLGLIVPLPGEATPAP
jgi:hypothetical protein